MQTVKETLEEYMNNNLPLYAAALSFYTLFALGPLFFILVFVGSLFFDSIESLLEDFLYTVFGANAQEFLGFMKSYSLSSEGLIATGIGLLALLFASIRLFSVLQTALTKIWEGKLSHGLRKSMVSLLLILVSAIVVIGVIAFQVTSPISNVWVSNLIGLSSIFLLLMLVYKIIPETPLSWNNACLTALITTVFFFIGKTVIWLVFNSVNAFSISNAVVALLTLIYYDWQVILLGSQYAKKYIEKHESKVQT